MHRQPSSPRLFSAAPSHHVPLLSGIPTPTARFSSPSHRAPLLCAIPPRASPPRLPSARLSSAPSHHALLLRAIPPRASPLRPSFPPPCSPLRSVFVRPHISASPQPIPASSYSFAPSSPLPPSLPPLLPASPPPHLSSAPPCLPSSPPPHLSSSLPPHLSSSSPPHLSSSPPPHLSSSPPVPSLHRHAPAPRPLVQVAAGVLDSLLPPPLPSLYILLPAPSPPFLSSSPPRPPPLPFCPPPRPARPPSLSVPLPSPLLLRAQVAAGVLGRLLDAAQQPHSLFEVTTPSPWHRITSQAASPTPFSRYTAASSHHLLSLPPTPFATLSHFLTPSHLPLPPLLPRLSSPPVFPALPPLIPHARSPHQVAAVVTQPPSSRGRGRTKGQLQPTAVGQLAADRGLPPDRILSPATARDPAFLEALKHLQPDMCITAAYGNFLPSSFLSIPLQGTVNIHPSLLPKFRGASPVQRALEQGVAETGVTVAYTVLQMDAGPIIAQERVLVADDVQAPELLNDLFHRGTHLLLQHLPAVLDGSAAATATPQDDSQATHAAKVAAEEGILNFSLPALTLHNKVRAFPPWPGTRASFLTKDPVTGDVDNVSLKLLRTRPRPATPASSPPSPAVAPEEVEEVWLEGQAMLVPCSDGSVLEVLEVQPESKRPMTAKQFWNGLRNRKLYRPA
ncbi:unnamed protein product [Closterium sp. NIES-64]|nr:unnamed protein product [Closterium sp. NIES-64]